jgi:hypothetical protein
MHDLDPRIGAARVFALNERIKINRSQHVCGMTALAYLDLMRVYRRAGPADCGQRRKATGLNARGASETGSHAKAALREQTHYRDH